MCREDLERHSLCARLSALTDPRRRTMDEICRREGHPRPEYQNSRLCAALPMLQIVKF
jgi:hypothetical protein